MTPFEELNAKEVEKKLKPLSREVLLEEAKAIAMEHPSKDARVFAAHIAAYFRYEQSASALRSKSKTPIVGDIIRITKHVYWDGGDCHPPGIIAKKGDIMQVRKTRGFGVIASHTPSTQAMFIEQSEYEFVNK